MRAGRMKKMVTLMRRPTAAVGTLGQPSQVWVAVRPAFSAAMEPVTGNESWNGAHYASEVDLKCICRYWSDILPTDRIRCDGKDYEIKAVLDTRLTHEQLELPLKWVRLMGDGAGRTA